MKAAAYVRVSKSDGSQTGANQEPEILRLCAARGWEPVWFREEESAVKYRPQWERVKAAVHRGEVGAVVVWALDRAGRDRVQLAHDLAEFSRKGATVVSVREPWVDQPIGPLRDLLIQVMAWFAESERARLIERTRAGQLRAWTAGKRKGRPGLPAAVVDSIAKKYNAGRSSFLAAKDLTLPESTVRNVYKRLGARKGFNPYPRKVSPAVNRKSGGNSGSGGSGSGAV